MPQWVLYRLRTRSIIAISPFDVYMQSYNNNTKE